MRGGPPDTILTQAGQGHHGNFHERDRNPDLRWVKQGKNREVGQWIMRNDWDIVVLFGILKNNK